VFGEIDRQVRATAEALRVAPTGVRPVGEAGLVARIRGDGDVREKPAVRLEQALAGGLVHARQVDHAAGPWAPGAFAESRALIDSRRGFVEDQSPSFQLQGATRKLVDTLGRKAADERKRIEEARAALVGLRAVHNRLADELAGLLDPNRARDDGIKARAAVVASPFSAGIGGAVDAYFREVGGRIERAIAVIHEVKVMMVTVNRKFAAEYGISPVEVAVATDLPAGARSFRRCAGASEERLDFTRGSGKPRPCSSIRSRSRRSTSSRSPTGRFACG
jgi:hypothetical protein